MFASRLPLAQRYVELLATEGTVRGLIGPRETPRLWERHLLNCASLADLIPTGATVVDIGSGAGLPGLVLAIRRPDLSLSLVEPLLRRTTFLEEVVQELGLDRVVVLRARAEELHGREQYDVVTSRALAPLPRLLDWSLPLVRGGGVVLALKGASAAREVHELEASAPAERARRGIGAAEVVEIGEELSRATVVRVERAATRR